MTPAREERLSQRRRGALFSGLLAAGKRVGLQVLQPLDARLQPLYLADQPAHRFDFPPELGHVVALAMSLHAFIVVRGPPEPREKMTYRRAVLHPPAWPGSPGAAPASTAAAAPAGLRRHEVIVYACAIMAWSNRRG